MTDPAAFDDPASDSPASASDAVLDHDAPPIGAGEAAAPVFLDRSFVAVERRPLGPGMWEAVLWIIGFFAIEVFGGFAWIAGLLIYRSVMGSSVNPAGIDDMLQPVMPWMIGSCKLAEVVAALVAIRLRFGRDAFRLTGFRSIPAVHVGILCFAVLPTAFLSGQLYALFKGYWDQMAKDVPLLDFFEKLSSIETVQEMAAATPLAALVLIIAVLPALNEEFVFRAAIGRGLVGRYGVIAGVALTSMLFAAMHMSPIHAAALIPLAVLIHVGYLSSGSIWWPVAVHFLNNAMSVVMMKMMSAPIEAGDLPSELTDTRFSPLLFIASLACVAATVWLLWTVRVLWWNDSDGFWEPDRAGIEPPPRSLGMRRHTRMPPARAVVVACLSYLLFPVALAVSLWLGRT